MRNKQVYLVSDEDFISAVKESNSIYQALKKMNLNSFGAAYSTFKRRCKELDLDLDHFVGDRAIRNNTTNEMIINACKANYSRHKTLQALKLNELSGTNVNWINKNIIELNIDISHWTGQGHLAGKTHNWSKSIPLEELLVKDSFAATKNVKNRLLKEGLLENKCYNCGIKDWDNKKLSFQLEHINGDHYDNRIENLTMLCPNCHSQTPTFCRAKSSFKKEIVEEKENKQYITSKNSSNCACGKPINRFSKTCKDCRVRTSKIEWPTNEELIKMVNETSYFAVGKLLGVSGNAVRKRLRRHVKSGATGET